MGFGKKRGRKEDSTEFERRRLTASATFLVFRILGGFEQQITELKTKFDKFVNSRAAGRRRRCVPGWSDIDAPLGTARYRSCTSSRKKNVIAMRPTADVAIRPPLAPTLGELAAEPTERVKHALSAFGTSPIGRGKWCPILVLGHKDMRDTKCPAI